MGCQLRPLDNDELQVLELVRALFPNCWKRKIRDAWMTGDYSDISSRDNVDATLQSLRNSHGPSWLCGLNLTKELAIAKAGSA